MLETVSTFSREGLASFLKFCVSTGQAARQPQADFRSGRFLVRHTDTVLEL